MPVSLREGICFFDEKSLKFACIDDKHRVKIGKLDAPFASVERGQMVIAHSEMQTLTKILRN